MASYLKAAQRKHAKGQGDHADAWLMSYADLITLLFMLFVILVSVSVSRQGKSTTETHEETYTGQFQKRSGTLALGTPYDEAYRTLVGVVMSNHADQYIAVEKTRRGITIDMSAAYFFKQGTAEVPPAQLPLLRKIADSLKDHALLDYSIEVEGHTDDSVVENNVYANNWELASMRATHIVGILIDEGMEATRLRATSYAGNRPLVPNHDAIGNPITQNRSRNQRVVIKVEKKAVDESVSAAL